MCFTITTLQPWRNRTVYKVVQRRTRFSTLRNRGRRLYLDGTTHSVRKPPKRVVIGAESGVGLYVFSSLRKALRYAGYRGMVVACSVDPKHFIAGGEATLTGVPRKGSRVATYRRLTVIGEAQ